MTPTHDFLVEDHGTIILFTPMNKTAEKWINTNLRIENWQWLGGSFGVDRRIGTHLVQTIEESGFTVAVT